MSRPLSPRLLCLCLSCLWLLSTAAVDARADRPFDYQMWSFFSNEGMYTYLGAGVALPLVLDGRNGRNHALRSADALGASVLLAEGLKQVITERWPNGRLQRSFPSAHSAAAFSVPTVESALHPRQSALWYTGATLIAVSRFAIHVHTVADVIAGSTLGYGIARLEISSRRGLLLFPLIQPDKHAAGLAFSAGF